MALMMLLITIDSVYLEGIVTRKGRITSSLIINSPAKYTENKIEHEEWAYHYQWNEKYPIEEGTHSIVGLKWRDKKYLCWVLTLHKLNIFNHTLYYEFAVNLKLTQYRIGVQPSIVTHWKMMIWLLVNDTFANEVTIHLLQWWYDLTC